MSPPSSQPYGDWLVVLWPLAILLHLAGNPQHLVVGDAVGLVQLVVIALAAWLLARPGTLPAVMLAGTQLVVFWLKLPVVGNHEVILALLCLAVVVAVVADRRRWPDIVAPTARAMLVVSYGFIALSKLNSAFFDPAVSCALVFGDEVGGLIGLSPSDSALAGPAIMVGTAAIELAIPVLLVVRRFRIGGAVLALSFHFLLAIDPGAHVWDFSATLLVLFVLFLPVGFHRRLAGRLAVWTERTEAERVLLVALTVALQAVALFGPLPSWLPAYPLWLATGGVVLATAAGFALDRSAGGDPGRLIGAVRQRAAGLPRVPVAVPAVVVGLALVNGVSPYLELRSAAAFNMYSNLAVVDGSSNHLVVPSGLTAWPRTLVRVVEADAGSPLRYYLDNGLLVPRENLDRHLRHDPDDASVIDLGQGPMPAASLAMAQRSISAERGVLSQLGDHLEHKLGFRRAVDGTGAHRCLRAWGPIG